MNLKKSLCVITFYVVFIVLLLTMVLYFFKLVFSEGRDVSPGTIESWILIPDVLKDESLSHIGTIDQYFYSMSDGPKPKIIEVKILAEGDKVSIEKKIKNFFQAKGFEENEQHNFRSNKDNQEFEYLIKRLDEKLWRVNIVLVESGVDVTIRLNPESK